MNPKEIALSSKTLVCSLQPLMGKVATIELRDETFIAGIVENVDAYMNFEMRNVRYTAPSGKAADFERYCVQGKYIRFVAFPEDYKIEDSIESRIKELSKMSINSGRGGRGGRGRGGRGGGRGRGGRYQGNRRSGHSSHGGYSSRHGSSSGYHSYSPSSYGGHSSSRRY